VIITVIVVITNKNETANVRNTQEHAASNAVAGCNSKQDGVKHLEQLKQSTKYIRANHARACSFKRGCGMHDPNHGVTTIEALRRSHTHQLTHTHLFIAVIHHKS
jgi:hypothetical protein